MNGVMLFRLKLEPVDYLSFPEFKVLNKNYLKWLLVLTRMKIALFVNSNCNAKCSHCYISYSGSRSPEDTLKTVKHLQGQEHEVIITGSETLLNLGYLQSYQQAEQKYLLTNGLLLHKNKSLYEIIKKHSIEELRLSLHFGIEDELKAVPEKVVAKVLKDAKEKGFKTQVAVTITSNNYQNIGEMCKQVVEYGANSVQFFRFVGRGRGESLLDQSLSEEQVQEFFDQVVELRHFYKDSLRIKPFGNFGPRKGSKGERMSEENNYCPALNDFIVISPDNNIYGCPFLMGSEHIVGRYQGGQILIEKDLMGKKRDKCLISLLDK